MKKVVTFGEVMLRLSTPGFARFVQSTSLNVNFGGGEANVSAALAYLGVPASHVTQFPDNDWGYAAAAAYRRYGVDTRDILFQGDRIGTYFLETGAMMRASRIIYDRTNSAFAQLDPAAFNWEEILADARWFHFTGISPAISEGAYLACKQAVATANRLGITVSADVNSRKNLWKWGREAADVMTELTEGCDIIVCGKGDAEELFGIVPVNNEPGFVSVCKQIQKRFPRVKKVINTKRGSVSATNNTLSGRIWNGERLFQTPVHEMFPMVDRIGGGDAFMAGFIYGQVNGFTDQKSIDFATAAGALKHSVEGDFNLVTVAEIETVMSGDGSGRLSR
ncbi:sugar kinase [Siphonobacter aquaeclarae]|jgi:2-dehydro-3-deoxygluconokinase|uniref:2-dehydro-3-deoxygluconokinase n=1 Tax=Siphonobacter aquaeclarae TaxID=563176 RepID=A0A1G9QF66_9BACT|nr:sugar kinase [Siphonobacter aquaeclarae]MBO9638671.1 sugar kinase [Siphonobacter aquaeclarae]SDM09613.1 2-dehydro-3-deoxygluconokinase [Siphonobacter aquaeclarae]